VSFILVSVQKKVNPTHPVVPAWGCVGFEARRLSSLALASLEENLHRPAV
jgi:hypothetical protein